MIHLIFTFLVGIIISSWFLNLYSTYLILCLCFFSSLWNLPWRTTVVWLHALWTYMSESSSGMQGDGLSSWLRLSARDGTKRRDLHSRRRVSLLPSWEELWAPGHYWERLQFLVIDYELISVMYRLHNHYFILYLSFFSIHILHECKLV